MLCLDDLPRIQRELARLKEEQDKAKGSLATLMEQLKKEHKCNSEEEAELLIKKLQAAELRILEMYNKEMAKFKQEFKEVIPND